MEDEDNAVYHLCLLNRTMVEKHEIFPYASLRMVLFAEVVALVVPEVSPSCQLFFCNLNFLNRPKQEGYQNKNKNRVDYWLE